MSPSIAAERKRVPAGRCIACEEPLPKRTSPSRKPHTVLCGERDCLRFYQALYKLDLIASGLERINSALRRLKRRQSERS